MSDGIQIHTPADDEPSDNAVSGPQAPDRAAEVKRLKCEADAATRRAEGLRAKADDAEDLASNLRDEADEEEEAAESLQEQAEAIEVQLRPKPGTQQ